MAIPCRPRYAQRIGERPRRHPIQDRQGERRMSVMYAGLSSLEVPVHAGDGRPEDLVRAAAVRQV